MKHTNISSRAGGFAVATLCVGQIAVGQSSLQLQFTTTPPVKRQIVVERTYNYELMDYAPHAPIRPLNSSREAVFTSPEGAVISNVSAMLAKDWQWFIDGWTPESAKAIEDDLQRQGITHQSMVNKWGPLKEGPKELISRINTGDYVIITYTTSANGKMFAVVKRENRLWHLTNDLHDDPILTAGLNLAWDDSGTAVIKRVVR